ncbi:MAG: mammalian cell entry protein [Leptospiraceae bacterium]|nr:MAG: mammalian cell entry protein [Leptospiraceae bacterium]
MNQNKGILIFIISLGIIFWLIMIGIATFTVVMPAKRDINLPYYLPVILKNAHGIQHGTRVNILGVDQGYIRFIDYFPIDKEGNFIFISDCKELCKESIKDQVILVVLNIRKQLEFYENYKLYTRYDNVIGEKIIEIDPGSKYTFNKGKKIINKKLNIKYLTPNELLYLINNQNIPLNKNDILYSTNYDDPITIIAQVVYENRKAIKRIFKNTAEITEKINKGKGTIALLLNEYQLISNTDKTLLEVILLIRDARELLESLRENKILSRTLDGTTSVILP